MNMNMSETQFLESLKIFEGYAEHMYLDSKGYVTIGIGIMLPTATAATNSGLSFINRKTRSPALPADISADFVSVSQKAPKKLWPPSMYAQYTSLLATTTSLATVFSKRLEGAKKDARVFFPAFDKLPPSAQWALVDMSFNLGLPKLNQFLKLKAALTAALTTRDWKAVAAESHRNGIQPDRNKAIHDWFLNAEPPPGPTKVIP